MSRKRIYDKGGFHYGWKLVEEIEKNKWLCKKGDVLREIWTSELSTMGKKEFVRKQKKDKEIETLIRKWESIDKENCNEVMDVFDEFIRHNPDKIKHFVRALDKMIGDYNLYVLIVKIDGIDYIKVGYTINDPKKRYADSRYLKGHNVIVDEQSIKSYSLQAFGAKEMEKKLKSKIENEEFLGIKFTPPQNFEAPGKGEFILYTEDAYNKIIEFFDTNIEHYSTMIGVTSPV